MTTFDERSRVVTWDDPIASWKAARELGGIDVLRAIEGGDLPPPPVARLIGLEIEQVSEGLVTFAFEPAEFHYNPLGTVHGGVISTLLDSALGCAVQTKLANGLAYTTVDLNVSFIRPVTLATGRLYARAETVNVGRRVGTARSTLEDADGKLYATATCSCLIFDLPS